MTQSVGGFSTPEDAAVASFPDAAKARAVRVEFVSDDRAVVTVDTEPSHPMQVFCERSTGTWVATGDCSD